MKRQPPTWADLQAEHSPGCVGILASADDCRVCEARRLMFARIYPQWIDSCGPDKDARQRHDMHARLYPMIGRAGVADLMMWHAGTVATVLGGQVQVFDRDMWDEDVLGMEALVPVFDGVNAVLAACATSGQTAVFAACAQLRESVAAAAFADLLAHISIGSLAAGHLYTNLTQLQRDSYGLIMSRSLSAADAPAVAVYGAMMGGAAAGGQWDAFHQAGAKAHQLGLSFELMAVMAETIAPEIEGRPVDFLIVRDGIPEGFASTDLLSPSHGELFDRALAVLGRYLKLVADQDGWAYPKLLQMCLEHEGLADAVYKCLGYCLGALVQGIRAVPG